MATFSRGTYGTSDNGGGGVTLGNGTVSAIQGQSAIAGEAGTSVLPSGSTNKTYSSGTLDYNRTGGFVQHSVLVEDVNGVAANDFYMTDNGSIADEQHSSKYAVKRSITSYDQYGRPTYGATDGTRYGLYTTSGTPVDKPIDAAKDPYGTPATFVTLDGLAPVVHSFSALTSY